VLVDLLGDTTFRLHPDAEATEMIGALKYAALLRGYRGQAPCDEAAAIDALLRVSQLLELCPEIQELELNPLKVLPRGHGPSTFVCGPDTHRCVPAVGVFPTRVGLVPFTARPAHRQYPYSAWLVLGQLP
jgi:hypothetical protein